MANEFLKERMKYHGVRQWEVAEVLRIPSSSFSVMLKKDLEPEFQRQVEKAISYCVIPWGRFND